MAQKTMLLDIVSAESKVFTGTVSFVAVTGAQGELGIYPGHTALITPIKPGQVQAVLENQEEQLFYISGGVIEVQPTNITILADTAARADDLDEAAANAAKEHAEKIIADQQSGMEYSTALTELAEAAAQLRAISQLRQKIKR
tara:strand:+ start:698 stop:1126 length:429 start_codon:yes stop_codon:yes gene_type:complete